MAKELYGNPLFEKVLKTACQVGHMSGLHLSNAHDRQSGEDLDERERVFRVLYSMDKQRVFLTGDPCDLYHFDSDLELRRTKPDVTEPPGRRFVAAMDDMMINWEEVYLRLYSARASAAGAEYLSSQVAGLLELLTKWNERHPGVLDASRSARLREQNSPGSHELNDLVSLQFEVRYCYHVTHVLILRCDRSQNEQAQIQMGYHARTCLRLIAEMGNTDDGTLPEPSCATKARLASLGRALAFYPIIAFTDLVVLRIDEILLNRQLPNGRSTHDESGGIEADIKLLDGVLRVLERLQYTDRPSTYFNKLRLGLGWAAGVLKEIEGARLIGAQTQDLSALDDAAASLLYVDGITAGSETGRIARPTVGECGFNGLNNWQDFVTE